MVSVALIYEKRLVFFLVPLIFPFVGEAHTWFFVVTQCAFSPTEGSTAYSLFTDPEHGTTHLRMSIAVFNWCMRCRSLSLVRRRTASLLNCFPLYTFIGILADSANSLISSPCALCYCFAWGHWRRWQFRLVWISCIVNILTPRKPQILLLWR